MWNPSGLQLAQIAHQCTSSTNGGHIYGANAKALERAHRKVLRQRLLRERGLKLPALALGCQHIKPARKQCTLAVSGRSDHLTR